MRKKIFFDANVLVDLINAANDINSTSIYLFNELRKREELLYCSPTSFAITYYLWNKAIKNKRLLNKQIIEFFSDFHFTTENHLIMQEVRKSNFRDLEDALQYFSAKDADVNVIITKNYFDFEHSKIPVYHPLEYINNFLLQFQLLMPYFKQDKPFIVPTKDGKLIEEHFGNATTKDKSLSIAHMVAPPGWGEPSQNPEFDEYTLVSKGKKMFEVDGEKIIVKAGESILVRKSSRVRYSNPFEEPCEYWSVCLPAFSIEKVRREE